MTLLPKEIEKFEHLLYESERKLSEELKKLKQTPEYGDDIDHLDEEADEAEDFTNRLSIETNLKEQLEAVQNALNRIQKKTYGICTRCGKEIALNVLEANPSSELCEQCKGKER